MGQIWRVLSCAFVRAQVHCLLSWTTIGTSGTTPGPTGPGPRGPGPGQPGHVRQGPGRPGEWPRSTSTKEKAKKRRTAGKSKTLEQIRK